MSAKITVLKEQGTQPPAEGVLSRFGEILTIGSWEDLAKLAARKTDIVLVDMAMPHFDAKDVLHTLCQGPSPPLILLFDSTQHPGRLLKRLSRLGKVPAAGHRSLARVTRLLGVSQEALARILNVSGRTAHRWLRGTRPRRKVELDSLMRVVSLLEETLPDKNAIRSYLQHPNPSLDSASPMQLLTRGEFARVEADLQAIQEGVYI